MRDRVIGEEVRRGSPALGVTPCCELWGKSVRLPISPLIAVIDGYKKQPDMDHQAAKILAREILALSLCDHAQNGFFVPAQSSRHAAQSSPQRIQYCTSPLYRTE